MDFKNYIKSELLILIPVMYFIGVGIKKSKVPNKFIPLILGCIAIILSFLWVLYSCTICGIYEFIFAVFKSITQGVLIAGASVYINQLSVQSNKKE